MVDIAQQLAAMQTPPSKTIPGIFAVFGGAIQRPSLQANGLFTGQIGGPFGIKSKGGGGEGDYNRQRMKQMKDEADNYLAQACAAAAPVQGTLQATGNIFEGNGLGGIGRGGGSFVDMG